MSPVEMTSAAEANCEQVNNTSRKALDINALLSVWTKGRRAKGGWWALAGFSFQSAIYLTRFFQALENGANSPSDLAITELLSDILVPEDGTFTLIQVKRTLDRPRLRAALSEAYQIAELCDVSFLTNLRFKIACMECTTPARPKDFSLVEIAGDTADVRVWDLLLRQFDEDGSIVEEPDPLDHLRVFLWNVGIRDAAGFIDDCLGRLLRRFGDPSPQMINELAWELNGLFYAARDPGPVHTARVGLTLSPSDFERDPQAATHRGILFDRRPQLGDLRLGRVRERLAVFSDLIEKFDPWWRSRAIADEVTRIPTFWIAGRSGEGKSVLLLQLTQRVLKAKHPPVITFLSSADDLPAWIEIQRNIQHGRNDAASLPAVAVVDDLHFIRDRDEWKSRLTAATDLIPPRVAVVTCGPTVEQARFRSDFSALFEVSDFAVPNLHNNEMEAFADWVADRTGQRNELATTDAANRMLVVWIFELLRGKSIQAFAANFGRRLVALDLFDLARRILAINALELPAPAKLVESMNDNQRDAFEALCDDSQLHFERVASEAVEGYRLSHPQIDWQLYREWASPPATLAQHWGRDLAASLLAVGDLDTVLAGSIIYRLGLSPRLSERSAEDLPTKVGTIDQSLGELYRRQLAESSAERMSWSFPRWLEVTFRGLAKDLQPNPVHQSVRLAGDRLQINGLPPHVAGWLWRLSEIDAYQNSAHEIRTAARSIISVAPPKRGIGRTLGTIAAKSKDREASLQLCKDWLLQNPTHEDGYFAIGSLIGTWPQDGEVFLAGLVWLKGNQSHQQAYQLLAPMVAARPADDALAEMALEWLADNPAHQQAYWLLNSMVAARPADDAAAGVALKWLEDNPGHQRAYELLKSMVAAHPADDALAGIALEWLQDNPGHQRAYELLKSMVAARPADDAAAGVALKWLEDNPGHQRAYELLKSMVAARPTDERVIEAARSWLNRYENHRQGYELLATLITRTDGAEEWMRKGHTAMLSASGGAKRSLLVALLSASKANEHYVELTLTAAEVESDRGKKTFLLVSLGRCLANNIRNAVLLLAGPSTAEHKLNVAQSLAHGLRKYPNRTQEFLEQFDTAPTEYAGLLLSACIVSEVGSEILAPVMQDWLNSHYRARGYGSVIKTLKQHPTRWSALVELGGLSSKVEIDYQKWH